MQNEMLFEGSPLEAALKRGWVRIQYTRLDGMTRIMLATLNPKLFSYAYKRTSPRRKVPNLIVVWDRRVGWRAMRRNRIVTWAESSRN